MSPLRIVLALALALALAAACSTPAPSDPRDMNLRDAQRAYERAPQDVGATVWYGRRLAYLGRFDEAIAVYTQGLAHHPDEPHLLRHRGHRHITQRRFDLAVADLERAASVATEAQMRAIEPDGQPNPRGIPLTTLGHNVWYHLALARFLLGDAAGAARDFERSLVHSDNPDGRCSSGNWLFVALCRTGPDGEARALARLAALGIAESTTVIENHSYHELCLLHLGMLDAETLLARASGSDASSASLAYGLIDHFRRRGDRARARALAGDLLARGNRSAFGVIAAEADLARGLLE